MRFAHAPPTHDGSHGFRARDQLSSNVGKNEGIPQGATAATAVDISCYLTAGGFALTIDQQTITDERECDILTRNEPGRSSASLELTVIDNTKITTQLGWAPEYTFDRGMKETIEWYLENSAWVDHVVSGDYLDYYSKMYAAV